MTALKENHDDTGRAKLPHHRKLYSGHALTRFIGSSMRADKEKLIFDRHQFFTSSCRRGPNSVSQLLTYLLNNVCVISVDRYQFE